MLFKQTLGWVAAVILIVFTCRATTADTLTIPNSFTSGTTIQSSQMNQNFTAVSNLINGNITNSNIKAAAAIAASKIDFSSAWSGTAAVTLSRTSANQTCLGTKVAADAGNRLNIQSDGALQWLLGDATGSGVLLGQWHNGTKYCAFRTSDAASTYNYQPLAAGDVRLFGKASLSAYPNFDIFMENGGSDVLVLDMGVNSTRGPELGLGSSTVQADVYLRRESAGVLAVRNAADSAYEDVKCDNLTAATAVTVGGRSLARYTSTAQTITAAGSLTLAHSLGTTPAKVWAHLKNTSAELNYSVNDLVPIFPTGNTGGLNVGFQCVPDGTNLNIRFGSAANTFQIINKTTGALGNITNANWNIIFYAEP